MLFMALAGVLSFGEAQEFWCAEFWRAALPGRGGSSDVGCTPGTHSPGPEQHWQGPPAPQGSRSVLEQPHLQEKQGIPACQSRLVLSISAVLPLAPIAG